MAKTDKNAPKDQDLNELVAQLSKRVEDLEKGSRSGDTKPVKTRRAPGKYALYVKEHFGEMKGKFPDRKAPEIMKEIAAQWKADKERAD